MKQIIVTEKQWNTIYTALKIEEVVLKNIRDAIKVVQDAKQYKEKNKNCGG